MGIWCLMVAKAQHLSLLRSKVGVQIPLCPPINRCIVLHEKAIEVDRLSLLKLLWVYSV